MTASFAGFCTSGCQSRGHQVPKKDRRILGPSGPPWQKSLHPPEPNTSSLLRGRSFEIRRSSGFGEIAHDLSSRPYKPHTFATKGCQALGAPWGVEKNKRRTQRRFAPASIFGCHLICLSIGLLHVLFYEETTKAP